MGTKQKTTTTGTTSGTQTGTQSGSTTSTYDWLNTPDWEGLSDLKGFEFKSDPSIGYNFASAKNRVANSFNNPLGGVYSPQIRDQILRSSLSDLSQQEAEAKSEDAYKRQGLEYNKRLAVAGMTAPKLVQTGGSYTGTSSGTSTGTQSGTSTTSSPWWSGLMQSLMRGAGTALMFAEDGAEVPKGQPVVAGEREPEVAFDSHGMRVVGQDGPEMFMPEEDTLVIPPELLRQRFQMRRAR